MQKPPDLRTSTSQPEARSSEFVAVEGGQPSTSAEALLVTAYILMWALVLVFVLLTWRRQQTLEARLGQLEKALSDAKQRAPD
ncbi:MAG TPA: CcmD family protein [Polyangiaceae bacterium]|jgi:hypothetical protein